MIRQYARYRRALFRPLSLRIESTGLFVRRDPELSSVAAAYY